MTTLVRTTSRLFASCVVAMLVACSNPFSSELTFTVTFEDGQDLRPGHFVFYRGVRVGEVTSVDLKDSINVVVTIDREHEALMHHDLSFFVERADLLGSEHRLVAYDCGAAEGVAIQRGNIVKGSEGWVAWTACKAKEQVSSLGDQASSIVARLGSSETATQLREALGDFVTRSAGLGQEHYKAFRETTLPMLAEKAALYKRELEQSGKLEEAKQFWSEFSAWLQTQ